MEYGVYLESSSIVSLRPRVLEFLNKLVEKAKDVKDFAITFKKKEFAEEIDTPLSSVSRYLDELENKNLITVKGARGRGKGTVIMFNTDAIHFETSDKAFINSDTPISIDDIVQRKLPNKPKKEPKWHRRSEKELLTAKALKNEKQAEIEKLNDELELLGGMPNWEWFEKTGDPVGNYRTYLISCMYNQYAAIYVEDNNFNKWYGNELPEIKPSYNVLGVKSKRFFGNSPWQQLDKFRKFCEENGIDPVLYLSAQFNRSIFDSATKGKKSGYLPFVNTLYGDTAYEAFKSYCKVKGNTTWAKTYKEIPAENIDFILIGLRDAYNNAEECKGFSVYKERMERFKQGEDNDEKEQVLAEFYRQTELKLEKSNVSAKTKDTIKKYLLTQLMIDGGGVGRFPAHFILGSEITEAAMKAVKETFPQNVNLMTAKLFGAMTLPLEKNLDKQTYEGTKYLRQYKLLDATPYVFRLIMERQGLSLKIADINEAIREYGKTNLPVDDYNFISTNKILELMGRDENYVEVKKEHTDEDMKSYTQTSTTRLYQGTYNQKYADLDDLIAKELNN